MVHRLPTSFLLLALALPVRAQNVVLDEGEFRILQDGRAVGTETFTIRRLGQGADTHVIANAVIELELPGGHEQIKPLLRTGPDLSLSAYQVEVSGPEPVEIAVTSSGRRLLARTRSPSGEQEREFRATPGTVLLEQGVAHQYWFLAQLMGGTAVAILVPRAGSQDRMEVKSTATESVVVAGERIQARHVTFELNGAAHEVWYDGEDRVLRVEVPGSGFLAERSTL